MAGDPNNMSFQGVVSLTVGTSAPPQRSVGILCTVAGNVNFQLADGSTITLPVTPGWQVFPFACGGILSSGTTATATYFNLA